MKKKLITLITISTIIRLVFAWSIELGNDEVYYRIFALFPDWSYFDHPPLVAWLIRLTTFGAEVAPEVLVRLGAVIIGGINTYLIYKITKCIASERAGYIAAILYTGSIYCSIIVGTFIMPDTPLSLFWLLSLLCFVKILPKQNLNYSHGLMLSAGVCIGLAMLSKYTGAYLWGAAGLYILIFNRKWLTKWSLWVSALISIIIFLPVIIWNVDNNFITFTFHGARVGGEGGINGLYVGRELMGGIFYNNPVNWVVAVVAVIAWFRGRKYISYELFYLLTIFSIPMIALFLGISLTSETLPHWAAPAYFALIILASSYLNSLKNKGLSVAISSSTLMLIIGIVGVIEINTGFISLDTETDPYRKGRTDFTLDMYGWGRGGEKFAELRANDSMMPKNAPLIQYGWDDAAHVANYFALPLGMRTLTIGNLGSTHYWEWINRRSGGFKVGDSVYLVVSSRYALNPNELYGKDFNSIASADTIKISRCGEHVYNFYVYRLLGLRADSRALKSQIN